MNRPFFKCIFPYCLIALAVFGLYGKTLLYELVYLDDHIFLFDYHWYFKDTSHWPQFFTRPDLISNVFYRPLLSVSFMFNALLGGQAVWVYRLTNLSIHILNASLFFVILKRLKFKENISLLFTLIFAVHPALVSANVWIPGRTDSLPAFFMLISFIFFLRHCEKGRWKTLAGISIFYVLALLSKESAVVFPLVCLCYLLCVEEAAVALFYQKKKKWLGFFLLLGVITGAWFMMRGWVLGGEGGRLVSIHAAADSIWRNLPALISYAGKVFIPLNLSTLPVLEDLTLVYGLVTIGLFIAAFIWVRPKRKGLIFFGIFWFLVFLIPSLVVSFLKHEYRLYLPMMGMMIASLALLQGCAAQRRLQLSLLSVIIIFFVLNLYHSAHYKNRFIFWHNAVKMSPHSPLAHRNLGAMYFLEGDMEKAEKLFLKARGLNPEERMVYNNLALIYKQRRQFEKAEEYFLIEIKINPDYANAYFNLGLLYAQQSRWTDAERSWLKTIALDPKYIEAYQRLAAYYHYRREGAKADYYVNQLRARGINFSLQ